MNLSVNLNKVCLLRNSRGATNPSPIVAGEAVLAAGAAGLTLHWREDRRHAKEQDVRDLCSLALGSGKEFNLEGDARPELVELAIELRPTQFTLVPVSPGEVTSDHGWDLPREHETVNEVMKRINDAGIRSAIFMDAGTGAMELAAATETQRVEIYTEPYAKHFATAESKHHSAALHACVKAAAGAGLGVNAGHDLDLRNTPYLAREMPEILEVSIGHALLADALYMGLDEAVRAYVRATQGHELDQIPRTQ